MMDRRERRSLVLLAAAATLSCIPSTAFVAPNVIGRQQKPALFTFSPQKKNSWLAMSTQQQRSSVQHSSSFSDSASSNPHNNNHSHNNGKKKNKSTPVSEDDKLHNTRHEFNLQLDQLASQCARHDEEATAVISHATQCEDLFRQALKDETENSIQPDVVSFNTVLKAWSKTSGTLADYHPHPYNNGAASPSSEHAHPSTTSSAFQQTSSSSSVMQNPVVTARDAVERATHILLEFDNNETANAAIVPDPTSYNIVIDGWAKSRLDDGPHNCERLLKHMLEHPSIQPDIYSYNEILEAWAHSHTDDALERVLKIYTHMEQHDSNSTANSLHSPSVQPNTRSVNAVVTAHSHQVQQYGRERKTHQAFHTAKAAHDFFTRTTSSQNKNNGVDLQPDVMTYTGLMECYGRCGLPEAVRLAEDLFQQLRGDGSKLQPNVRTYTALIMAYSRCRSMKHGPQRAQKLLDEMEQSHHLKPNARTYTAVLQCWARSGDPGKAQRALRILQHMRQQHGADEASPTLATYNAAIDCCARCQGDSKQQVEALKIAFAVLKTMEQQPKQQVRANHVTYATLLKASECLIPAGPERNQVARAVFDKARDAGMVEQSVITALRKAVDSQIVRELLEPLMRNDKGHLDYTKIPSSWSKHVW